MSKFQLILTGIFGLLLVIGIAVFSIYKGSSSNVPTVVIWGTIPQVTWSSIFKDTPLFLDKTVKVTYQEKSPDRFDAEFIESLASGDGPDLFMLPSSKILKHRNKVYPIPYDVFTQRQFKDSFIEGSEIYMLPEGVTAFPIYADPLVMYWNRSIFTNAGLTAPPKYWDEFYNLASQLTKKDGSLNITQSAVSMGEFANIAHAKEIVANLAMQAGTSITTWSGENVLSVFSSSFNKPTIPAEVAVNFYTEFGNPAKTSYSWNRSLPSSTNFFLSGNLALYFGFADEINALQLKNPNLNFDVASMPVSREGGSNVDLTEFNALAVTRTSKNPQAAFYVATTLAGAQSSAVFSSVLHLPPARRDLLGKRPTSAYESTFYDGAIKGKTWLDPDPDQTDEIFKNMIESITSGKARTQEAVARADRELNSLMSK